MKRVIPPHTDVGVDEYLSLDELSKLFRLHRSALRRWTTRGVVVRLEDGTKARLILPYRKVAQSLLSSIPWLRAFMDEATRLREVQLGTAQPVAPAKRRRKSLKSVDSGDSNQTPSILARYGLDTDDVL